MTAAIDCSRSCGLVHAGNHERAGTGVLVNPAVNVHGGVGAKDHHHATARQVLQVQVVGQRDLVGVHSIPDAVVRASVDGANHVGQGDGSERVLVRRVN